MKRLNGKMPILVSWLLIWLLQPLLQTQGIAADPERISLKDFKVLFDNAADIVIVDVRSQRSYEAGHIPGAISIPVSELEDRHQELPLDKTIILY